MWGKKNLIHNNKTKTTEKCFADEAKDLNNENLKTLRK